MDHRRCDGQLGDESISEQCFHCDFVEWQRGDRLRECWVQAGPGSQADVYFQMFTPTGSKLGGEVLVNQFTANNQRTPTVAALPDGRFVVGWVSEQERFTDVSNGLPSVDVYARVYDSKGGGVGNEILVNTSDKICAAPDFSSAPDGGFMATWMEKDLQQCATTAGTFTRGDFPARVLVEM